MDTLIIGGGEVALAIQNITNSYIIKSISDIPISAYNIKYIYITSGYLDLNNFFNKTNEDIENEISANFIFNIQVIKQVEYLLKTGTKLIVFSSSVSFESRPGYSIYSAMKTALEIFIKTLYNESKYNLKIVRPSRIDTKLRWNNIKDTKENRQFLMSSIEVAKECVKFSKNDNNLLIISKAKGIKEEIKW